MFLFLLSHLGFCALVLSTMDEILVPVNSDFQEFSVNFQLDRLKSLVLVPVIGAEHPN
jgi:hypothetical protein